MAESTHAPAPAGTPSSGRRAGRILVILPLVAFAALAGLFLYRLRSGEDPSRLPSALIGQPVPNFDLPPLAGLKTVGGDAMPGLASQDLRSGKVTIVNVWASWCAPCRVEHPLLMDLADSDKARLVSINYKDQPENARRFLGSLGNPFSAVGRDETGRTAIDWGVYGVPETFVISPKGRIVYKQVGPLSREALPAFMAKVKEAASQ